jgi:NAD(P)-dependent dehydrogenase (short-subunit alcohol dehydrogenase family)
MTRRREFLTTLGTAAAALALDAGELRAAARPDDARFPGTWDTSWLDALARARYRAVFNTTELADGVVLDYVSSFMEGFRMAHGTDDRDTCAVVVFRRSGTPLAFGDAVWDRYAVGESTHTIDAATRAPARRNPFAKQLDAMRRRGMIALVCNVAMGNWSGTFAEQTHQDRDAVRRDVAANLVPGAILVPSGVYALVRAQNAGCAWMPGT